MKKEIQADTIIKDWFLVDFTHAGELMNKQILWGIVVEDRKGRWVPGDYCCTSLVLTELDEQVFQTNNSIYCAKGEGQRVTAPAEAINLLRAGYSPEEWESLAELKKQFPESPGE